MSFEAALPFILIAATVVGTALAVLLGRYLDRPAQSAKRVLAAECKSDANQINLNHKGVLFAPKSTTVLFETIFEHEYTVGNIGFDCIENVIFEIGTQFSKSFEAGTDFADYSIDVFPSGIKHFVDEVEAHSREARYIIRADFLNRGDRIVVRTISSCSFTINITAHLPNTEFRVVDKFEVIPPLRERLVRALAAGRILEFVVVSGTVAMTAAMLGLR